MKKLLAVCCLCVNLAFECLGQNSKTAIDKDIKFATFEYGLNGVFSKVASIVVYDNGTIIKAKTIPGIKLSPENDDTTIIRNIHLVFRYLDSQGFKLIQGNQDDLLAMLFSPWAWHQIAGKPGSPALTV